MYASGSGSRLYHRDLRSPDQYQRSRNYDTRDDNSSYKNDRVKTWVHQYDRSPSRQRDYHREVKYNTRNGGPKLRSHEWYNPRQVKSEGRNLQVRAAVTTSQGRSLWKLTKMVTLSAACSMCFMRTSLHLLRRWILY